MKKVLLGLLVLSSVAQADIHEDRIDVYTGVIESINNQMVDLKVSFGEVRIGNISRIYTLAGITQIEAGGKEFVLTDTEYARVKELLKIRDEMADKIMVEYSKWKGDEEDYEVTEKDEYCVGCMSTID